MIDVTKRSDSSTAIPPILVALAIFAMAAVFAALIFVPAGRLDWMAGWIYPGIVIIYAIINWACLARWNSELIERRMYLGEGTKTWDKIWAALYAPVMTAIYVVAGLEARDEASDLRLHRYPIHVADLQHGEAIEDIGHTSSPPAG